MSVEVMGQIPVSVIILTKNEEKAIRNCLESVTNFKQVVVVDSNSTDSTCAIVSGMGRTCVNFNWNGKYPKKKQWALELSEIQHDWVLFLDADERISSKLLEEINDFISSGKSKDKFVAGQIALSYKFLGRTLKYGHKVKKIALVNRNYCHFQEIDDLSVTNMWEVEGHYQPVCEGQIANLTGHLFHDDPDPLFDYFSRHNRYSDWEAELRVNLAMRESVRNSRTTQGKIFEKIPGKPIIFFLYSYLLRGGWRDGIVGFHYALALSFYYWQISLKTLEKKLHETTR